MHGAPWHAVGTADPRVALSQYYEQLLSRPPQQLQRVGGGATGSGNIMMLVPSPRLPTRELDEPPVIDDDEAVASRSFYQSSPLLGGRAYVHGCSLV